MPGLNSFTKLLLHGNGSDGSTAITDSSPSLHGNGIITGTVEIDTAQSKFGGASVLFDNASYVSYSDSTDWDWTTNDLTIDCWVRFPAFGSNNTICARVTSGGSYMYLAFEGTGLRFRDFTGANNIDFTRSFASISNNTWHHVAVIRTGSTFRMFLDGVQQGADYSNGNAWTDRSVAMDVGHLNVAGGYEFDGWIDELRIQNGEAFWTTNFTPPTSEYSAGEEISINETVLINDSTTALTNPEVVSVNETVLINDSNKAITPLTAKFASKIISVNPLYIVTDEASPKLVEVDITDPVNPLFTQVNLVGVTNAKSIAYSSATNELYVACADGMVVKVDATNLNSQTIIDLSDTDDLLTIDALNTFGLIYTSTENTVGELYSIDNSETFLIDTDFNVLSEKKVVLEGDFNSIEGFLIESNFEVISQATFVMNTDFKCLTVAVDSIVPIAQTDCDILIDSVSLEPNDILVETISIRKSVDERDFVSFTLCRQHDNPNRDFENNLRTITNQNNVEIKIDGITVFTGKVSRYLPSYSTTSDQISVEALGDEAIAQYNRVTLPLGSINKRLNIYEILLQSFNVYNPDVDANSEDPVKFKGIRVPLGEKIEEHVARRTFFDPLEKDAERINDGSFISRQNHTYFWSPTVRKFGNHFFTINSVSVDNEIQVTEFNQEAKIPEIDPTVVDKDADKSIPFFRFPDNNATGQKTQQYFKYIGTSLTPVSSDLWFLIQAKHRRQKIFSNTVTKLGDGQVFLSDLTDVVPDPSATLAELKAKGWLDGSGFVTDKFKNTTEPSDLSLTTTSCDNSEVYDVISDSLAYTIGSAPFNTVSAQNGILLTKPKWVDESNGLYSIKEEGYDYTEYVKKVAELEYQKLININGDVLPETSANIELSIDSFFYYNLNVLTRINIDNTVDIGIYKNNQGFPVAIKSLTINCGTMRVSLDCDNLKSNKELEDIDGQFPCEDDQEYITPRQRTLVALKSDMNNLTEVDGANSLINDAGNEIPKVDQ